ncbi:MAG: hypothetical protein ACI9SY_000600 [Candidatus Paceibacteria bacterium]|jgi:hypothetical protein
MFETIMGIIGTRFIGFAISMIWFACDLLIAIALAVPVMLLWNFGLCATLECAPLSYGQSYSLLALLSVIRGLFGAPVSMSG